jgi:hypothetical protein
VTRSARFFTRAPLAAPLLFGLVSATCRISEEEAECLAELGIEVVQQGEIYYAHPFDLAAVWNNGNADDCVEAGIEYEWSASDPQATFNRPFGQTVQLTPLLRGTVSINLKYGTHTATRQLQILRTEGDVDMQIRGLPAGVNGSIDLFGPSNFTRRITQSGVLTDIPFGSYRYNVNNTTGGTPQHKFEPLTLTGTFELPRNARITASVEYRQTTGQYDFEATNLPTGATGNFGTLTGSGVTYQLTSPRLSLALEAGLYQATYTEADPTGYQFTPSITAEQYAIASGATTRATVNYTARRGRLEVTTPNLPQGATAPSTVVGGGMTRTPNLPGGWYYMPGGFTLNAGEALDVRNPAANRFEDYRPEQTTHSFNIAAGQLSSLSVNYQLKAWRADWDVQWAVKADPFIHHPHLGPIRIGSFRYHAMTGGSDAALGTAAASALTISGAAPFISLTGTLNDDGSFSASGSGNVVGFPNVAIVFTGTISTSGALNGEMKIGSDTAPTGLPNGSITYTITGTRRVLTQPSH